MKRLIFSVLPVVLPLLLSASGIDYPRELRAAELAGNRAAVADLCRAWYNSGEYSTGVLHWNYNALMSVENDAVLLTQNDDDTCPGWMLQYALELRPDVRILNVEMLRDAAYRDQVAEQFPTGALPRGGTFEAFMKALHTLPGSRPVYFGVLLEKNLLEGEQNFLYLTGLALKYSLKPFDNVAQLRANFENRFLVDYLRLELQPEREAATVQQLNLKYIPALVLLQRHYTASGETSRAEAVQNLALQIGRHAGREEEVRALLSGQTPAQGFVSSISVKKVEKNMRKVSDNLYAAATETTNEQYEQYLEDLLKSRDFDRLNACRTYPVNWRALLGDSLKHLPDAQVFRHGHPDGPDFPVQNISYASAKQYCDWLTQVYNQSTEKKKYKKVVFRLPTEAEWVLAARGGIQAAPFPWGGYYVRNSKGCYLGNYNVANAKCDGCEPGDVSVDGGFFPVRADSYFPNNFGLYCVSGNVSEMLSEEGVAKGGSWQLLPHEGNVDWRNKYSGPSPGIGFRVFMEVLE